MRRIDEMNSLRPRLILNLALPVGLGLVLSACATIYGDRSEDDKNSLKDLAAIGGMATQVPEAKDFVVESRTDALGYIPIGAPVDGPQDRTKPLSPEELLLLQQRLEAAQRNNNSVPADE